MKQPELGKKIFEIRNQKGFTQEELVEKCNINVRTIQRIEAGEVTPRNYTLKRILEALNLPFDTFFYQEKNEEWTEHEKKKISLGSIFGFTFLVVSFLIAVQAKIVSYDIDPMNYKIMFFIFHIICAYFLLNAFRLVAKKYNNTFLERACYVELLIILIVFVLDISISENKSYEGFNYRSLLKIIPITIGGALFGIGMLKFKNIFKPISKRIGVISLLSLGLLIVAVVLLIVNENIASENNFSTVFAVSHLLITLGSLLLYFTKLLEVLLLRDISKEVRFTRDDTVHFVKL